MIETDEVPADEFKNDPRNPNRASAGPKVDAGH